MNNSNLYQIRLPWVGKNEFEHDSFDMKAYMYSDTMKSIISTLNIAHFKWSKEEYDEIKLTKVNENTVIVGASYKILELEDLFDIKINVGKTEEIDTIGGLVFYIANKVPKINDVFTVNKNLQFKVLNADERRIITLEVKKNI